MKSKLKINEDNTLNILNNENNSKLSDIECEPDEIWVEIPNVDKPYKISNYGRIVSYVTGKGVLLRNKTIAGYKTIDLRINGIRKNKFIHKLVAELFIPNDDSMKKIVCHIDYDKLNNKSTNLKWVTSKELFAHTVENNEKVRVQFKDNKYLNKNSKLTKLDVEKIRDLLQKGVKQNIIAKLFCVSEMQVSRIKRNENWTS